MPTLQHSHTCLCMSSQMLTHAYHISHSSLSCNYLLPSPFLDLTGGELAAIIIVCIIVFVVVLVGSILLCIFCCCPRQTVCYHVVAARRAQRSSGAVQLQAHPPTSSRQPRQQTLLINPEPPKYEDAVTHSIEPHSSSLPPYKE